ncbi:IS3 family transposase [Pseudomonas sp. o96-267]
MAGSASDPELKGALFDYIRFYNHSRRHSTLDCLRLIGFERRNASSRS